GWMLLSKHCQSTWPILRDEDIIILGKSPFHLRADFRIIIHDQEFWFCHVPLNPSLVTAHERCSLPPLRSQPRYARGVLRRSYDSATDQCLSTDFSSRESCERAIVP